MKKNLGKENYRSQYPLAMSFFFQSKSAFIRR